MTDLQRRRNDIATTDKREMADKLVSDSRDRNDEITQERRDKADRTMNEHRAKNDEMTADRRDRKDGNMGLALAVFLLLVLAVGAYFVFI